MDKTKNQVLREVTEEYLKTLDISKSPAVIEAEILDALKHEYEMHNSVADKGQKWRYPDSMTPVQIAMILLAKETIRLICQTNQLSKRQYMKLGVYNHNTGLYEIDVDYFKSLIREYNFNATSRELEEIISVLKEQAPVVMKTVNKDLVPVNNGIFNYSDKKLYDFDSKYVFLAKSTVDYNPKANVSPRIVMKDGTIWTVDSFIDSLSDDQEVRDLIWEILSAILRPNVKWNKAAWFIGNGNNGKGTLCELMRNLVGRENCASIPLKSMSNDFLLEPLIYASAVIVDENDDEFIDNAANLKTICSSDVLGINIKFQNPVQLQPHVFMVQCINEMPRSKDKSNGFYRRQLFVPFEKDFTGKEIPEIKDDYLKRKDVLEYILYRSLNTDFYSFTETEISRSLKEEFKEFNDPVRQFVEEFVTQTKWNFLPKGFLFEGYKSWFEMNNPSGKALGKKAFLQDLKNILEEKGGYEEYDVPPIKWNQTNCSEPEYLIQSYNITEWMNLSYKGNDWKQRCTPVPRQTMAGWLKVNYTEEKEGE